jgi:hypothetical protein
MSAEGVLEPGPAGLVDDPRARHVLRYAFGATVAMAISALGGWPLSYLIPVLGLTFLAKPTPPPSLPQGLFLLGTLMLAVFVGLWVIKYLLGSSVVFFAGLGLLLLRVFYAQCSGAPPILTLWLLLVLLILPFVAVQSPDAALFISQSLLLAVFLSVVVAWIGHAVVPETRSAPAAAPAALPPRSVRFGLALERFLVVFPVVILFHVFELSGAIVTLIFVALLSIQPGFASNFKGGIALMLGNALGGFAAIVGFQLLTVVPELSFLLLICFFGGLFFGARLFGGGKLAPVFGMAFSTMLLILGSSTSSESGEAASAAYARIAQIMLAVVYVVTAFGLIRRWREASR